MLRLWSIRTLGKFNMHFVQTSATGTTIEPCQAPLPLPPTNSDQVLNRLGKDEYSNLIVNLCSFSGLEEKDLLKRSYADYLEGCDSVIVKGRLRVNVRFWEGIGASQFILSVIREGYKIPFYYTPTSVRLQNNNSALPILILSLMPSLNFLKLVRLSSALFLRWLLI